MNCQACKIRPIEVIEKCDDEIQPYELCEECHKRLITYSLRPIEWYNLACIHTFNKFLLHDDFYEDNGIATQPEDDVEESDEYRDPSLNDVKNNIESLLNCCITKWWLEEDMVNCLKNHNPQILLKCINDRFNKSENYFVRDRLFEVVARSLGSFAGNWIREQWVLSNGEHITQLSSAAFYCLSFEEGYDLVINALENIQENELPYVGFACLYMFRTPLILDWIEDKVKSPVKGSWGRLAAASNPSWNKLNDWIQKGRPYSFVAIDTLVNLIPHTSEHILNKLSPKPYLDNPSTIELMSKVLEEYMEKDNVPRVKQGVEKILSNWKSILGY